MDGLFSFFLRMNGYFWTDSEIEFLCKNMGTKTNPELAKN